MRSKAFLAAGIMMLALGATARFGAAHTPDFHLALSRSEPAADSTVTAAPTQLRLFWTEPPTVAATQVRLTGANNQAVQVSAPKADAKDAKILNVPITAQITPGVYTVTWRTAGEDGHVLNGTYKFTYRAN
jgi:methionine-rich copper-binding protein CopC